jgi:hypothetical protein
VAAVEELARKDDLTLLFSAISSGCPAHNAIWRKTASDVLLTVSRHALSQPVISYLHGKGCIALCIGNRLRSKTALWNRNRRNRNFSKVGTGTGTKTF